MKLLDYLPNYNKINTVVFISTIYFNIWSHYLYSAF